MNVHQAILAAEQQLPGEVACVGDRDPRWQAIIRIGDRLDQDPEAVWHFVRRWGASPDADLRAAIATCLLEHLLETDFAKFFPHVEVAVRDSRLFADTFRRCWKFGQSELAGNSERFDALMIEVGKLTG
jgi:hypothetical protein